MPLSIHRLLNVVGKLYIRILYTRFTIYTYLYKSQLWVHLALGVFEISTALLLGSFKILIVHSLKMYLRCIFKIFISNRILTNKDGVPEVTKHLDHWFVCFPKMDIIPKFIKVLK